MSKFSRMLDEVQNTMKRILGFEEGDEELVITLTYKFKTGEVVAADLVQLADELHKTDKFNVEQDYTDPTHVKILITKK